MLRPERSENGKNVAKNNRIRPQKTVFCARENRFNRSLHILSKLFLQVLKNQVSFHITTLLSTYEKRRSHCFSVTVSKTSLINATGMVGVAILIRHAAIDSVINCSTLSVQLMMSSLSITSRNAWSKMVFFSLVSPAVSSNVFFSASMALARRQVFNDFYYSFGTFCVWDTKKVYNEYWWWYCLWCNTKWKYVAYAPNLLWNRCARLEMLAMPLHPIRWILFCWELNVSESSGEWLFNQQTLIYYTSTLYKMKRLFW